MSRATSREGADRAFITDVLVECEDQKPFLRRRASSLVCFAFELLEAMQGD